MTYADLRFLDLSPAARHALLGMRALAETGAPGRFYLAADCARRGGVPENTLSKIFQRLGRRGLLVSQKGPGGGYRLARPASEILLADIVRAAKDLDLGGRRCLIEDRLCADGRLCLMHGAVLEADGAVMKGLASFTLADLAAAPGRGRKGLP